MTSQVAGAPGSAGSPGRRTRRWIWPALVATAIIAVGLLTASLTPTDIRAELDPRSAIPDGSRAVAQILHAQGVRVDTVTRSDDAVRDGSEATTIIVAHPSLLGPRQWQRLQRTHADLVLVEPDLAVLNALAPAVTPVGTASAGSTEPNCSDPDAVAAGPVTAGGNLYSVEASAPGAVACYPNARHPERRSLLRLIDGGRRVTVLGQRQVLQNASLTVNGNAALALRILGAHPQLRWYLPDPVELGETGDSPTMTDLMPRWFGWALVQLGVVTIVIFLWRGRRLGRVVTEPLPVVVRSVETVEGRARLYRLGRARDRASGVLRTAAARRLAARLGVPAQARPEQIVQLVAEVTGRDPRQVHQLLLGEAPRDDSALVTLAAGLDVLEREVTIEPSTQDEARPARSGQRSVGWGR